MTMDLAFYQVIYFKEAPFKSYNKKRKIHLFE